MKKQKLPAYLYYYTSPAGYQMILSTGKLLLTPSNLKHDSATFHREPIGNGQAGFKYVDKYELYHPVVWLTANDRASAQNTGLSDEKLRCRITLQTNGKVWRYLPWRIFCQKYHASPEITSALKRTADDFRNWFVCEGEIPVTDFFKIEFLAEDGIYKTATELSTIQR